MSREHYENLRSEIEAIEDANIKIPNMPIDVFLQEAANLEVWCKPDIPKLVAVGVDRSIFKALPKRTAALRYVQSLWMKERFSKEQASKEWEVRSPEAKALKDELEHSFRFAFRKHEDLLAKVRRIEEGSGQADLVQDLSDLAVLGKSHQPVLEKIGFDVKQLTMATKVSEEMSKLLATKNGERLSSNATRVVRDKAYTYLKEVMDEIREAGKFVFWKDKERLNGYYSARWTRN